MDCGRGDTAEAGANVQADVDLLNILKNVISVIVFSADSGHEVDERQKKYVDEDLANRLCLPLTQPLPLVNYRLVVVVRDLAALLDIILATTHGIRIRITLLCPKEACPVPEDKRYSLESCIQIPGPRDESPPEAIVASLSSQGPFHGIVTFGTEWATATAKVARELGLCPMSPNLVQRMLNKHTIRPMCGPVQVGTPEDYMETLEFLKDTFTHQVFSIGIHSY